MTFSKCKCCTEGWNPGAGGDQALGCWSRVHLQTPSDCWLSSVPAAAGLQFPFPWLPARASQLLKRHFSSCGCPHLKPAMVSQVLLLWISDFCWQPEKTQGPHDLVSCSQIISLLLYNIIMGHTHRFHIHSKSTKSLGVIHRSLAATNTHCHELEQSFQTCCLHIITLGSADSTVSRQCFYYQDTFKRRLHSTADVFLIIYWCSCWSKKAIKDTSNSWINLYIHV